MALEVLLRVDHAKPTPSLFHENCRVAEPYRVPLSTNTCVESFLFLLLYPQNAWVNVSSSWGTKQASTKTRWFKVILSSDPLLKLILWSYWKLLDFLERLDWIAQLLHTIVWTEMQTSSIIIFNPTHDKCTAMLYVKPTSIFWGLFLLVDFSLFGSVISPDETPRRC